MRNILNHHSVAYEEFFHRRGRIYVKTNRATDVASKLTRVFGISSVSPSVETTSDIDRIAQTAVNLSKDIIESNSSFAVRCHRVGKHLYSSMDICKEVGKQVLTKLKDKNLRVELQHPNFTINTEIREDKAYIFSETKHGPGGFPLGSQAKVVCLLSGGIDSAVACWLAMKRGCPIIPIYFDNMPYTDEAVIAKTLDIAKQLFEWSTGFPRKVYVIPNGKNLEAFVKEAPRKLTCILCKRMMYRIAEQMADMEKAEGIITGEAIGEQASQTMYNLRVLNEAAVKYPIHRPLLGFDKTETEALARKIGTFEISTRKAKGCSAAPYKPSTKAKLEIVKNAEEKLDIENGVRKSVKEAKIVTI